ncbi:MAG: MFS transporter [Pseudomonadales bacterium]|nr:MFS transporter [Pseudomonadales bacterium]
MTVRSRLTLFLLLASAVVCLAATDLVLPAIPVLPDVLGGTPATAQYVMAGFALGSAIGLIGFGELGARFSQHRLLVLALAFYALVSWLASRATELNELSFLRLLQGMFAAAPAVFTPGIIRRLLDESAALRAIGLVGSIESLVPALAPVAGAWLLDRHGWNGSFLILALAGSLLSIAWTLHPLPPASANPSGTNAGYLDLLRNRTFLRYAISQAGTLGGLLIFVFGAPAVIVRVMHGELADFIVMQVVGITGFVIVTNLTARIVSALGMERAIQAGTALSAFGGTGILAYALIDGSDPRALWLLFLAVNVGLGVRGPPGFYQAVVAAGDNAARGAALVMLFALALTAGGTALVAPWIADSLVPLALVSAVVSVSGLLTLRLAADLHPSKGQGTPVP